MVRVVNKFRLASLNIWPGVAAERAAMAPAPVAREDIASASYRSSEHCSLPCLLVNCRPFPVMALYTFVYKFLHAFYDSHIKTLVVIDVN